VGSAAQNDSAGGQKLTHKAGVGCKPAGGPDRSLICIKMDGLHAAKLIRIKALAGRGCEEAAVG